MENGQGGAEARARLSGDEPNKPAEANPPPWWRNETTIHFHFDWLVIFLLTLIPVSLVEIVKMIRGRFSKDKTAEAET